MVAWRVANARPARTRRGHHAELAFSPHPGRLRAPLADVPPRSIAAPAGRGADAAKPRGSRKRPQAQLQAHDEEDVAVSDWASLFGDLARTSALPEEDPVEWRVHDRTHLEFAIDYRVDSKPSRFTWEAYFFVPESFRLHEDTYSKNAIYDDLLSYVRLAVPSISFPELSSMKPGSPLDKLRTLLMACQDQKDGCLQSGQATRMLRLHACLIRAAGVTALREIERELSAGPERAQELTAVVKHFAATCGGVGHALRRVLTEARQRPLPEEVDVSAKWADEDVSLLLETLCATLGVQLEQLSAQRAPLHELAEVLAARAVSEARHRRAEGYDSVGSADASERHIEHLEFRRHVLKRFTSSVLWLTLEVHEGAAWVLHTLYALAAAVAMAFALVASFSATPSADNWPLWRAGGHRVRGEGPYEGVLADRLPGVDRQELPGSSLDHPRPGAEA
jgi:hypothetical protein